MTCEELVQNPECISGLLRPPNATGGGAVGTNGQWGVTGMSEGNDGGANPSRGPLIPITFTRVILYVLE